jgi:hypothetical protein
MCVRGTESWRRLCVIKSKRCGAGIVGPVYLDTVNAERHLELLEDHFVATLQGTGMNMGEIFYQEQEQDHIRGFPERTLSQQGHL